MQGHNIGKQSSNALLDDYGLFGVYLVIEDFDSRVGDRIDSTWH